MSIVYSRKLLSWQGLGQGQSVTAYLQGPTVVCTAVIRTVVFYWGGPSPVLSNSAVLLDLNADDGRPTLIAYNSGITQSSNPIYQHFDGFWPIQPFPQSTGTLPLFNVVNTSEGTVSVDVFVGGWLLTGEPGFMTFVNTP